MTVQEGSDNLNSSIIIQIESDTKYPVDGTIKTLLKAAADKTLAYFPLTAELIAAGLTLQITILLADSETMKALNSEYMYSNVLTDVLSFPSLPVKEGVLSGKLNVWDVEIVGKKELVHLGDIAICPERAAEQATRPGRSLREEMVLLTVHGCLHLLGFDHSDEAEEIGMFSLQNSIIRELDFDVADDPNLIEPDAADIDSTERAPHSLRDGSLLDSPDAADIDSIERVPHESPEDSFLDLRMKSNSDSQREAASDFLDSAEDFSGNFKAGYVAIIGRPNVGKSTLLNYLIGTKIAIISPKPQTTQKMIRGVYSDEDAQIVLLDTPGIHKPSNRLGQLMLKAAEQALLEADVVCLMIEAGFKPFVDTIEHKLLKQAEELKKPIIIILNKTDIAAKEGMLPLIDVFNRNYEIKSFVPVSAKSGEGVDILISEIKKALPLSEPLYSEENYSDQTERMLAAELIRESILYRLQEELPYGTAVMIESFDEEYDAEGKRTRVKINAIILTERDSHKRILLGKGGNMIKNIGINSRENIEKMLGCPVDLTLFVKVRADWRNKTHHLRELDFESRNLT